MFAKEAMKKNICILFIIVILLHITNVILFYSKHFRKIKNIINEIKFSKLNFNIIIDKNDNNENVVNKNNIIEKINNIKEQQKNNKIAKSKKNKKIKKKGKGRKNKKKYNTIKIIFTLKHAIINLP